MQASTHPAEKATDDELIGMTLRGEAPGFRQIMQRYNHTLYRVARSILGGDGDAEDVLQEAYLRAFAHLHEFRGDAQLSTWLTRIVVNESLGRLRRRKQQVDVSGVDDMARNADAEIIHLFQQDSNPETTAARANVRRMLERAIDGLPDHFRIVFVMRDVEDFNVEETANFLGLRTQTVKTRLHRARRLLRQALNHQLQQGMSDAFPFGGARCARFTDHVMLLVSLGPATPHGAR